MFNKSVRGLSSAYLEVRQAPVARLTAEQSPPKVGKGFFRKTFERGGSRKRSAVKEILKVRMAFGRVLCLLKDLEEFFPHL